MYAWKTRRTPIPERAALGAPSTGWIHEGHPPWRVIVFPTLALAREGESADRVPAEYTGTEATVTWDELLPPPARSTAKADAERLHYHDGSGTLRCPDEYRTPVDHEGLRAVRCPHLFDVIRYES